MTTNQAVSTEGDAQRPERRPAGKNARRRSSERSGKSAARSRGTNKGWSWHASFPLANAIGYGRHSWRIKRFAKFVSSLIAIVVFLNFQIPLRGALLFSRPAFGRVVPNWITANLQQTDRCPIQSRSRAAIFSSQNPDPLGLRQCPATFRDSLTRRRCQMNFGGRVRGNRDLERQEPIVSRPARRDLTADTLGRASAIWCR